jgi:hypothetical protein
VCFLITVAGLVLLAVLLASSLLEPRPYSDPEPPVVVQGSQEASTEGSQEAITVLGMTLTGMIRQESVDMK